MKPPMQPVCVGVNEKGELIWEFVPMPRWQQAMFPVRYVGDFLGFWLKHIFYEKTGFEADPEHPSMELHSKPYKKRAYTHPGD